jgi:hypothetical protein
MWDATTDPPARDGISSRYLCTDIHSKVCACVQRRTREVEVKRVSDYNRDISDIHRANRVVYLCVCVGGGGGERLGWALQHEVQHVAIHENKGVD